MSAERFTLDTNILIYSIDTMAAGRHRIAKQIVDLAATCNCWLTLQAVSEFYAAATRKGLMPTAEAAAQANDWLDLFPCMPPTPTAIRSALGAAVLGRASYWDALLLATAAEGGCTAILTEDLDDRGLLGGVRIVNPFGKSDISSAARAFLSPEP
jgi:predicted nucleic acid-binding protein